MLQTGLTSRQVDGQQYDVGPSPSSKQTLLEPSCVCFGGISLWQGCHTHLHQFVCILEDSWVAIQQTTVDEGGGKASEA